VIFIVQKVFVQESLVELIGDNIYCWAVKIYKFDMDSDLYRDLQKYSQLPHKRDHILLHFNFRDSFPHDPPFVRVVYPVITQGFVTQGGAICMELLTKQGWSSAYNIESIIMQISATLVKGRAKICFEVPETQYSAMRAQQAFRNIVHLHNQKGWHTPPKSDG
jgi:ubiquitin-conjugating enzyme E2 Q